jgi:hypothetical protein
MNGCGLRDEAAFGRLCRGKKAKGFAAEFGSSPIPPGISFRILSVDSLEACLCALQPQLLVGAHFAENNTKNVFCIR